MPLVVASCIQHTDDVLSVLVLVVVLAKYIFPLLELKYQLMIVSSNLRNIDLYGSARNHLGLGIGVGSKW